MSDQYEKPRSVRPTCLASDHNWQPWFYSQRSDRWTRMCARWNCQGREEISTAGVGAR